MDMRSIAVAVVITVEGALWGAVSGTPPVQQIVQRSVENINVDWSAAPSYNFQERDVISKDDSRSSKTYEVMMIDGSPYNTLIAVEGRPLSAAQAAAEQKKLEQEIARRRNENPRARQKRIAEDQRERRQDNALIREMAQAFDFKFVGEETLDGRRCFVLDATPRPGYVPRSRDTKVLKGMRGKMWIDEQHYQWVKVHAEVFRPVTFGLFLAHVEPGTAFTLEQRPVAGKLWLPSHFEMSVNAQILILSRRYTDDETYSNYRPAGKAEAQLKPDASGQPARH